MTEQAKAQNIQLGEYDRLTSVMMYTSNAMIWGKVIAKQAVRVSTWLRTDMVPKYFQIVDANVLLTQSGQSVAPLKFDLISVQTDQIDAFHLIPPAEEALDYDPDEPNRIMVPTIAIVHIFQFDGYTRMSEVTNLTAYLSSSKGDFLPLYDVKMTSPALPKIKGLQAPYLLIRQSKVMFAEKT